MPITDLFAVRQALTLFANPVTIRAALLVRCIELDQDITTVSPTELHLEGLFFSFSARSSPHEFLILI